MSDMTEIFINTTVITLNLIEFSICIELFFTENVTPNFAAVKWIFISWLQKIFCVDRTVTEAVYS